MTSNMPQRYIDREGVDEMEVANIYHASEMENLTRDKQRLMDELVKVNGDLESEKENHALVTLSQYHRWHRGVNNIGNRKTARERFTAWPLFEQ